MLYINKFIRYKKFNICKLINLYYAISTSQKLYYKSYSHSHWQQTPPGVEEINATLRNLRRQKDFEAELKVIDASQKKTMKKHYFHWLETLHRLRYEKGLSKTQEYFDEDEWQKLRSKRKPIHVKGAIQPSRTNPKKIIVKPAAQPSIQPVPSTLGSRGMVVTRLYSVDGASNSL